MQFCSFGYRFGSSEIWSDKLSLIHIKGTQRRGEHGGESRQSHGGAEGTKSDRGVVCVLLIALVINVFKTHKYPLMLHVPTVPLCLTISAI